MNEGESYFGLILVQRNLLFQEGQRLMVQHDYWQAQKKFSTILTQITDLQAMYQLGRCQQFSKDYKRSLETYQAVFSKNQTDPRPVYQQGYVYDLLGQDAQALDCFEKAKQIYEENRSQFKEQCSFSVIYYTLGVKYSKLGRHGDAYQAFEACSKMKNPVDYNAALQKMAELDESQSLMDASQTQQFKATPQAQINRNNSQLKFSKIVTQQAQQQVFQDIPRIQVIEVDHSYRNTPKDLRDFEKQDLKAHEAINTDNVQDKQQHFGEHLQSFPTERNNCVNLQSAKTSNSQDNITFKETNNNNNVNSNLNNKNNTTSSNNLPVTMNTSLTQEKDRNTKKSSIIIAKGGTTGSFTNGSSSILKGNNNGGSNLQIKGGGSHIVFADENSPKIINARTQKAQGGGSFFRDHPKSDASSSYQSEKPPSFHHHHQKGSSTSSTKAPTGDQSDFPLPSTLNMQKNLQLSPSDILYAEKFKELSDTQAMHHPFYPVSNEGDQSITSFDEEIPDEKEGEMMQRQKNFKNVHAIKNIPMKSIMMEVNSKNMQASCGLLKPSQISGASQMSSYSRFTNNNNNAHNSNNNTNNELGSLISVQKKEFEHPEKSLNAYETRKRLGEGSFGRVYEVIYKVDGNSFALKILPNNSILRQHLTSGEVEVMKQLNHKNVIKIYNAFKTDDQQSYCIVSELADNGNLKEYIQKTKGKINKFEILNMMKQMLTALHYIHSQRIIHRDIKPGNIFLHGISRQIKIGDFGIAKKLSNKEVQQALNSLGTEKYFSPEYTSEGFSASSDVWSMGIVFLELLGVSVADGFSEESKKKYFKQIPPELSDIIAGMLQHDPRVRSTSVAVINQLQLIN